MIKFGTGGWRAIIGEDFVRENICRVARGIAALAREEQKTDKPVIVGYDRRFLSESAAKWVAEILADEGFPVWFLGRSAPTPLIMHTVKTKDLHYGIEITASHNPSAYNGIKLIVDQGRDASLEVTARLETLIPAASGAPCPSFDRCLEAGRILYLPNPFNDYLDDIMSLIDIGALRRRGLRVLFDTMHGSGTYPLQVIFHTARCTIDTMNLNKDAWFGGMMPAPTEKSLGALQDQVILGRYDFGIAMDGDGDRLGIVDKTGRYISANQILCMLYYYLVKHKGWTGPVVRNVSTTHMLDRIAESFGQVCYEVPVGFKYISSMIDRVDAVLGGESSGGLTVRGHIHGKDSIYAASLFAEMISVMNKTPSEIADELEAQYGRYVMEEDSLRFTREQKQTVVHRLLTQRQVPEFQKPVEKVSYMDGCKVCFTDGSFVSCRFSGTEPLLRIFAEASDSATALNYITVFKRALDMPV